MYKIKSLSTDVLHHVPRKLSSPHQESNFFFRITLKLAHTHYSTFPKSLLTKCWFVIFWIGSAATLDGLQALYSHEEYWSKKNRMEGEGKIN